MDHKRMVVPFFVEYIIQGTPGDIIKINNEI